MALESIGDKKFHFSPNSEEILSPGDKIVVLGPRELINNLIALAKGEEVSKPGIHF